MHVKRKKPEAAFNAGPVYPSIVGVRYTKDYMTDYRA